MLVKGLVSDNEIACAMEGLGCREPIILILDDGGMFILAILASERYKIERYMKKRDRQKLLGMIYFAFNNGDTVRGP